MRGNSYHPEFASEKKIIIMVTIMVARMTPNMEVLDLIIRTISFLPFRYI